MEKFIQTLVLASLCTGVISRAIGDYDFCSKCQCRESIVICTDIGSLNFLLSYNGQDVDSLTITGSFHVDSSEDFQKFRGIQELYLQLSDLHANPHIFGLLGEVVLLDLRNNLLTEIDGEMFASNTELVSLDLRDNDISYVASGAFAKLARLSFLTLSGNRLQRLSDGVFAGLSELIDLDLGGNGLQQLSAEQLAPLSSLEVLHLEDNALRAVDAPLVEQLSGLSVWLRDNPFRCACDTLHHAHATALRAGMRLDISCDTDDTQGLYVPWDDAFADIDCNTKAGAASDESPLDVSAGVKPLLTPMDGDENLSSGIEIEIVFEESDEHVSDPNTSEEMKHFLDENASDAENKHYDDDSEEEEEYSVTGDIISPRIDTLSLNPAHPSEGGLNLLINEEDYTEGDVSSIPDTGTYSKDVRKIYTGEIRILAPLGSEGNLKREGFVLLEERYEKETILFIFLVCVVAILSSSLAALMIVLYVRLREKHTKRKNGKEEKANLLKRTKESVSSEDSITCSN